MKVHIYNLPPVRFGARLFLFVLCLCALPMLFGARAMAQPPKCTECDKSIKQLNGHGAHSTSDPRRVINVQIGPSWGTTTNANIFNGVCAGSQSTNCGGASGPSAISLWNAVGSPYYFDLRQDAAINDVDFLVVKDASWDYDKQGCAVTSSPLTTSSTNLRVVHLPPNAANWSQADLACILAHEIGHGVGLDGAFPGCNSVMTEIPVRKDSDCKCPGPISQRDVDRANLFTSNPQNCKAASKTTQNFGGPGYEDPNPYRYIPTCYYFYESVDVYYCRLLMEDGTCHPEFPPVYIDTIYILRDVRCY